VVGRASYDNVRTRWVPELQKHAPGVPYILVGTKTDLRSEPGFSSQALDLSAGERLAKDIASVRYLECSALTMQGVKEVFDEVIRVSLGEHPPGSGKDGSKPKGDGTRGNTPKNPFIKTGGSGIQCKCWFDMEEANKRFFLPSGSMILGGIVALVGIILSFLQAGFLNGPPIVPFVAAGLLIVMGLASLPAICSQHKGIRALSALTGLVALAAGIYSILVGLLFIGVNNTTFIEFNDGSQLATAGTTSLVAGILTLVGGALGALGGLFNIFFIGLSCFHRDGSSPAWGYGA